MVGCALGGGGLALLGPKPPVHHSATEGPPFRVSSDPRRLGCALNVTTCWPFSSAKGRGGGAQPVAATEPSFKKLQPWANYCAGPSAGQRGALPDLCPVW